MLWMCDRLTEVLAATLKVLWWRKSYALELKKKKKTKKKVESRKIVRPSSGWDCDLIGCPAATKNLIFF